MSALWRITLFGGLTTQRCDTQSVGRFETRRTAALLALLTLAPGRAQSREILAEWLWPDDDIEAVRDRFRHALAALRRTLEPPPVSAGSVIIADRVEVRLNFEQVTSDVAEFEAAIEAARAAPSSDDALTPLRRAAALYQGELLSGFYDDWIQPERERLASAFQRVLSQLAGHYAAQGEFDEALTFARRAVAADPYREEAHGALMRLYAAAGRRSDVSRQYRELERILQKDDLIPAEEMKRLLSYLQTCPPALALQGGAEGATPRVSPAPRRLTADGALRVSDAGEPDGGAVPLQSPYYVERPTDAAFSHSLLRGDSIVLVKGARQIGKTSLLARGLRGARENGMRVALTDFQKLTAEQLVSADSLFLSLAEMMTDQLDLDFDRQKHWNPGRGWNVNFERFLRRTALGDASVPPLIWAMDEIDRLFGHPFSAEVFGLFRSWHNERALDPDGPWGRLTLAIAYATEAHLFITDLNQSPFNVGVRLTLEDFTQDQVRDLNRRYGSPLKTEEAFAHFYLLTGGHPYLTRRGLSALAFDPGAAFVEKWASQDNSVFGDHLRRVHYAIQQDNALTECVCGLLREEVSLPQTIFYRLRSAGVIIGAAASGARFRCELYRQYLEKHLL